RADRALERALAIGAERGEHKTVLTAEAVLDEVRRSRAARQRAALPALPAAGDADGFAADLVRTLNSSLVTR
ncbi:MAG TPA: hypothetical protein VNP72_07560, partial [Longimicrobium sp.]|nr:hypothetical protein [Longimicrobium sp.]